MKLLRTPDDRFENLLDYSFKPNYVEIDGSIKGHVKDISWRSTRIKTLANNIVIVPNTKLANAVITNYDHPVSKLSVGVTCGVAYGSDLAKVEKLTIATAKKM